MNGNEFSARVLARIQQIGINRVAAITFGISVAFVIFGLMTRFVMIGYVFGAIYLVISVVLFVYGWQSTDKERPLDVQPYKLHRGRGMPQNPRDIYWLALQRFWGLLDHGGKSGQWETAELPSGNKLRMLMSLPGGTEGAIYWQDTRSEKSITTRLGQFSGKCIQGLASVYGTESFGMSEKSKIRLLKTDMYDGDVETDMYGAKFVCDNEEYLVFAQRSVIDALMNVDNSRRTGGKFIILENLRAT